MDYLNQVRTNRWRSFRSFLFFFALLFSVGGLLIFWEPVSLLIVAYPENSYTLFLVWVCALAVLMPPRANYDGG